MQKPPWQSALASQHVLNGHLIVNNAICWSHPNLIDEPYKKPSTYVTTLPTQHPPSPPTTPPAAPSRHIQSPPCQHVTMHAGVGRRLDSSTDLWQVQQDTCWHLWVVRHRLWQVWAHSHLAANGDWSGTSGVSAPGYACIHITHRQHKLPSSTCGVYCMVTGCANAYRWLHYDAYMKYQVPKPPHNLEQMSITYVFSNSLSIWQTVARPYLLLSFVSTLCCMHVIVLHMQQDCTVLPEAACY